MKVRVLLNCIIICIITILIPFPFKIMYSAKTLREPAEKKVCLIMVDGLRYDAVEKMPFLNSITKTRYGILYKAYCEVPTLSRPGYERILTGTETTVNLIDRNNKTIPSSFPSLFYIAKQNRLKTAFCGFYWINQLYPYQIDYDYYYHIWDTAVFKKSKEIINKYMPDFIVIHPMILDFTGHKYGGTSSEYINTAKKIDTNIEGVWKFISQKGYSLIVVSDHGHMDKGGHGGGDIKCLEIPIALISNNLAYLKPAPQSIIKKQTDIAPTVCDILGMPKTAYMTGSSLVHFPQDSRESVHAFSQMDSGDLNILLKVFPAAVNLTFSPHSIICMFSIYLILRYSKNKVI